MELTVNINEVEFKVGFDYQPPEPAERGPYAQYPGCGASIDGIWKIEHKGTDFVPFFEELYGEELKEIEALLWSVLEEKH